MGWYISSEVVYERLGSLVHTVIYGCMKKSVWDEALNNTNCVTVDWKSHYQDIEENDLHWKPSK